jgi:hypothetical protein
VSIQGTHPEVSSACFEQQSRLGIPLAIHLSQNTIVTAVRKNMVLELAGAPPHDHLRRYFLHP